MAEEEPNDDTPSQPESPGEPPSGPVPERRRRRSLTPELRRFLGTPRPLHERRETEKEAPPIEQPVPEKPAPEPRRQPELQRQPEPQTARPQKAEEEEKVEEAAYASLRRAREGEDPAYAQGYGVAGEEEGEEIVGENRRARAPAATVTLDQKSSRVIEFQHVVIVLGAIFLLFLAFYAGKKYSYWKYLLLARNKPKLTDTPANKYPNVTARELVEQALVLQSSGQWSEAADRLLAAKHKDPALRGILFRLGKLLYDHRNFDQADRVFERTIAFGENLDTANFYRGLIATRRRDLPAATRFFEAASNAEPFNPDYYFYWAEALRLDFHPREAIPRYEKAALRARNKQDEKLSRFKIRLAHLEAAESPKISAEVEIKRSAGPLSVDWLMTAAALAIRAGHIGEAAQLISKAQSGTEPGLFSACLNDMVFQEAAKKHPELPKVTRPIP